MGEVRAESVLVGRHRYFDDSTFETLSVDAPVWFKDDFVGKASDQTNDWNVSAVNSGAGAVVASGTGGVFRLTTGAADDDDIELASALVLKGSKRCVLEVRAAMNDVVGSGLCIALTDAVAEGVDTLALTMAAGSLVTSATDAAGFIWDPDAATQFVRAAGVKADADSSVLTSTVALANAAYHVFRIEINADGDADFYIDGAHVGQIENALTASVALCAYVGLINREGAANTADVDYVAFWQDR